MIDELNYLCWPLSVWMTNKNIAAAIMVKIRDFDSYKTDSRTDCRAHRENNAFKMHFFF